MKKWKKLHSEGPEGNLSFSPNSLPWDKTRFLQSQKNLKAKANIRGDTVKDSLMSDM